MDIFKALASLSDFDFDGKLSVDNVSSHKWDLYIFALSLFVKKIYHLGNSSPRKLFPLIALLSWLFWYSGLRLNKLTNLITDGKFMVRNEITILKVFNQNFFLSITKRMLV